MNRPAVRATPLPAVLAPPIARRAWLNPLVTAKTLLARFVLLAEFCHRCGKRQRLVWHAPDDVFARHRGGYNVLCPDCFSRHAERHGLSLVWDPKVRDGIVVWVPRETRQW